MRTPGAALPARIPRLDLELTGGCDHRCGHCYNVWNADEDDPQAGYKPGRGLKTQALVDLVTRAVEQTGCTHVTVTGGEPLLHRDALDVIAHVRSLVPSVTLITNGSHVDETTAERLGEIGLAQVQLTLLAGDRDLHDHLKGAACFDDTVRAAVALRAHRVPVQVCFVAMSENHGELTKVLDLCHAIGVRALSYNRMSPAGGAVHHIAKLMPTADQIEADLEVCEAKARAYGITVGTAMPIPPCLVRHERFPWVRFGGCSTGSHTPNIVMDTSGRLRSCNLASGVLGDLSTQTWDEIRQTDYPRQFTERLPEPCQACAHRVSCQGGCKESGFAVFGDHAHMEPLLWLHHHPEAAGRLPRDQRTPS